jgi:hypothetical protein
MAMVWDRITSGAYPVDPRAPVRGATARGWVIDGPYPKRDAGPVVPSMVRGWVIDGDAPESSDDPELGVMLVPAPPLAVLVP